MTGEVIIGAVFLFVVVVILIIAAIVKPKKVIKKEEESEKVEKKVENKKEEEEEEENEEDEDDSDYDSDEDSDDELERKKKKYAIDENSKLITVQTKFTPQESNDIIFKFSEKHNLFNLHGNLYGGNLKVKFEGKMIDLIDFGACAYMSTGELPQLKELYIKTLDEYGANSHSNAYYEPLLVEDILKNFGKVVGNKNIRLCLSTTLGNMDLIPATCEIHKNNCIIVVDQYAHNSLMRAIKLADKSIPVKYTRHLDYKKVEEFCKENPEKTIVYVNDGLFSMEGPNGIGLDAKKCVEMCEKYKNLEIYVDEAHGFGWCGKYGRGYFLSQIPKLHPRMTVICSLRKAVSGYGAFAVFGSTEKYNELKYRTPSWFFQTGNNPISYSLQLAQSRFLLSTEYVKRAKYMEELIKFRNDKAEELGLESMFGFKNPSPLATLKVPVRTVGGILDYFKKLYYHPDYRYYVGIITWPNCKLGEVGLRYTTRYCHSKEQVAKFLESIKKLNEEFSGKGL